MALPPAHEALLAIALLAAVCVECSAASQEHPQCALSHRITAQDQLERLGALGCHTIAELHVTDTVWIRTGLPVWDLRPLRSLREVRGSLQLERTSNLTSLEGLEGLVGVGGTFNVAQNAALVSIQGLSSLSTVGTHLYIIRNNGLTSLRGLEALRDVWGDVSIQGNPTLQSLRGLENLARVSSMQIKNNGGANGLMALGDPFASGGIIRALTVDDNSWPRCITPHERAAIAVSGLIRQRSLSAIPESPWERWHSNGCGPGPVTCVMGRPCSISLAGADLAGVHSVSLSEKSRGCGACRQGRENFTVAGGAVDFADRLWDESVGVYSLCKCSQDELKVGPVAQITLAGPEPPAAPFTCVRGAPCSIVLHGVDLGPNDEVQLKSSCMSEPLPGGKATRSGTGNTYVFEDLAKLSAALPNRYEVCWMALCAAVANGSYCAVPRGTVHVKAAELMLHGAFVQELQHVVIGDSLTVPDTGLGVSSQDRMRLLRRCGHSNQDSLGVVEANSSAYMQFEFGALTPHRIRPAMYKKCWCQMQSGHECNADVHFMADTGTVWIVCPAGHEVTVESACRQCPQGKVQDVPSLNPCLECPAGKAPNDAQTRCESSASAGMYRDPETNGLATCPKGYYCTGSGVMSRCPAHADTRSTGAVSQRDCICTPGHFRESDGRCMPCQKGLYKPNMGNDACTLSCPAAATSEPGAAETSDCFCSNGTRAELSSVGELLACLSCNDPGLDCRGGFEVGSTGVHAMPTARKGFFQTGLDIAVECKILAEDSQSVCLGGLECVAARAGMPTSPHCVGEFGNVCAEGASGVLCGQCARGFARNADREPCTPCEGSGAIQKLMVRAITVLGSQALLNVIVASMAATSSQRSSTMHAALVRVLAQWLAACSVITQLELQLLLPWPEEVSRFFDGIFWLSSLMPLGSLQHSIGCLAEAKMTWQHGKMLMPGMFFLVYPVLLALMILVLCSLLVYCILPMARKVGPLVGSDRDSFISSQLGPRMDSRLKKMGLVWRDIEEANVLHRLSMRRLRQFARRPKDFTPSLAQAEPLAAKMMLFKLRPKIESSLRDGGIDWDDLYSNHAHSLRHADMIKAAAMDLRPFVDSIQVKMEVSKLRPRLEPALLERGIPWRDAAALLFERCDTRLAVEEAARDKDGLVGELCQDYEEMQTFAHEGGVCADAAPELAFGLFGKRPALKTFLWQVSPVLWVALYNAWPFLLQTYLQMIWCTLVPGSMADGRAFHEHRLLTYPDVVCWGPDHHMLMALSFAGLVLWCVGGPLALLTHIWALGARRHSPGNVRRYGYFLIGYEPMFWWWDLVVKRMDVGLMILIAFTSIANDDRARLLLYPLVSGLTLSITCCSTPFDDRQAGLLSFMEGAALMVRFVLFSVLAVLLIFAPTTAVGSMLAICLAAMACLFVGYIAFNIAAQYVQAAEAGEERVDAGETGSDDGSGEESESLTKSRGMRMSLAMKELIMHGIARLCWPFLVLLRQSKRQRLHLHWKDGKARLCYHCSGREPAAEVSSCCAWHAMCGRQCRCSEAVQRVGFARALGKFHSLWLKDLAQDEMPESNSVIYILTLASKRVPCNMPLESLPTAMRSKALEVSSRLHKASGDIEEASVLAGFEEVPMFTTDDVLSMVRRLVTMEDKDRCSLVESVMEDLRTGSACRPTFGGLEGKRDVTPQTSNGGSMIEV